MRLATVAAEAGVAAGLVHHHFESKDELLSALLRSLVDAFRQRVRERGCWVGVLAEAVRDPALFTQVRWLIDSEIATLQRTGALSAHVLGALVLGGLRAAESGGLRRTGRAQSDPRLRAGT